ncbi:HalOD1 output domain-containing protein [Salinigranum salinum]|uniref:HalOD1 output domain-containing protein n=1 Tax=Salinigranum salinum TaxID=1364937 RepID=UPI0012605D54|nr:HalOD1 output domain-containing protein [Salinigranum salinum]
MADSDRHAVDGEPRQYSRDTTSPCSHAIVSAVATHLDCSPLDLEPLYLRVDPDALDALVDRQTGDTRTLSVSFGFAGCTVDADRHRIHVARDADTTLPDH